MHKKDYSKAFYNKEVKSISNFTDKIILLSNTIYLIDYFYKPKKVVRIKIQSIANDFFANGGFIPCRMRKASILGVIGFSMEIQVLYDRLLSTISIEATLTLRSLTG